MSQSKDPTIKLFGRTIPLPDCQIPSLSAASSQTPNNSDIMDACSIMTKVDGDDTTAENSGKPNKSSALWNSEEQEQSLTLMNKTQLNPKSKEDQIETNSGDQEEVFKKPDKILPCPRCNSYDTKFCYFNNYSVNQPRHYCRKCHRYWTAGGTMRNVPIGAGRRKHKHLASQYGQVMVSSNAAPISQVQNSDSASHELLACGKLPNPLRRNRVVLEVGSDGNFSMENVLNLKDQKIHAPKSSVNCGENGEEPSLCGSSVTVSSFLEHNMPEKIMPREQGGLGSQGSCNNLPPPQHLNCYPIPWAFTSNVGWNNATHIAPMMAIPGLCTSSTPVQFVPASFLGYKPIWPGIIGNISMAAGVNSCPSPSSSTSNSCPGKRPRIDDPDEGSKLHTCGPLGMIMKSDQTDQV